MSSFLTKSCDRHFSIIYVRIQTRLIASVGWVWRQYTPPKRRSTFTRPNGAVSQNAVILIFVTVRTWNLTYISPFSRNRSWHSVADVSSSCASSDVYTRLIVEGQSEFWRRKQTAELRHGEKRRWANVALQSSILWGTCTAIQIQNILPFSYPILSPSFE
jgi:hypothetical protein